MDAGLQSAPDPGLRTAIMTFPTSQTAWKGCDVRREVSAANPAARRQDVSTWLRPSPRQGSAKSRTSAHNRS
jgi:hypothetical protein